MKFCAMHILHGAFLHLYCCVRLWWTCGAYKSGMHLFLWCFPRELPFTRPAADAVSAHEGGIPPPSGGINNILSHVARLAQRYAQIPAALSCQVCCHNRRDDRAMKTRKRQAT